MGFFLRSLTPRPIRQEGQVRYLILFVFYFCSQHITFRPNSPKESETHPGHTENKGRTPRVTKDSVEELADFPDPEITGHDER